MAHFDSIFFDGEQGEWMQRDSSDEEHPDCELFGGEMSEVQTKLQQLADALRTEDQWEYQIAESLSGYYWAIPTESDVFEGPIPRYLGNNFRAAKLTLELILG